MVAHGTRLITAEFAVGIIGPFILGVLSLRAGLADSTPANWMTVLGIWLLGIAANYIPLFIYAVLIARDGTVEREGRPELAHAKRYGVQQVIILVPLLVCIVAVAQEMQLSTGRK